jgi:ElaB/YqjD/DUF883 family membrane-anchored ribosome-binding protein
MSESLSREMKAELVEDFNAVVAKAETFLHSVTNDGAHTTGALRGQVARKLRLAKEHLRDVEDAVAGKTRQTARAADAFVHENPWQTVGAGAGLGLAVGLLIGVLFNRH